MSEANCLEGLEHLSLAFFKRNYVMPSVNQFLNKRMMLKELNNLFTNEFVCIEVIDAALLNKHYWIDI